MISGGQGQFGTWTVAVVVGSLFDDQQTAHRGSNRLLREQVLELARRAKDFQLAREGEQITSTTWFGSAVHALEAIKEWLVNLEGSSRARHLAFSASVVTGDCNLGDLDSSTARKARMLAGTAAEGQALVGISTYDIARESLPESIGFKELGTVLVSQELRLEQLYQLTADGLRESFPSPLLGNTVINNSPREFGFLIGRHEERDLIQALLERDQLVTIVGPTGIGKSHLACRAASGMLDTWAEGIVWVDLVGVTDPNDLRLAVAEAFGLKGKEPSAVESTVVRLLRGRKLVVVFDGADMCQAGVASLVAEILRSSGPRLIVTCTKSPGSRARNVVRLGELALPPRDERLTVEELEDYESSALFLDRARLVRPNFDAEPEVRSISEICHRLNGNPMALVLAARHVRSLKPERILERLATLVEGNGGGEKTPTKRHASLANAVEWSGLSLEPSARDLIKAASVMRGGWRIEDLAALVEREGFAVAKDVEELLDAGLVGEVEGLSNAPAYKVVGAVANAVNKTSAKAALQELGDLHSEYFIGLLCRTVQAQGSSGNVEAMRVLDWYRRDIEAALEHTIRPGQHPTTLVEAMVLAWPYWYNRNRTEEGLRLYLRAIKVCPDPKHIDVARLLNGAGILSMRNSDVRAARIYYKRALAIAHLHPEYHNYAKLVARTLGNLASVEYIEGRLENSIPLYVKAIEVSRQADDAVGLAGNLASSVGSLVEAGDLAQAEKAIAECRPINSRSPNAGDHRALVMGDAMIAWLRGDLGLARDHLVSCADLATRAGDLASLARCYLWLAQVEMDAGNFERAAEFLGAMRTCGNSSGTHLYPIQELRAAKIEGLLRNRLGERGFLEHRLSGEISANLDGPGTP